MKTNVSSLTLDELAALCVDDFFERKLKILRTFTLKKSLRSCNPYALALARIGKASEIVEERMKVHVNASDEILLDETFLQPIARMVYGPTGPAYGRAKVSPSKDITYPGSQGKAFWTEITGDPDFYLRLIAVNRDEPAKHRQEYEEAWAAALNRFTRDFSNDFCFQDGRIDWEKLVRFVSEDTDKK